MQNDESNIKLAEEVLVLGCQATGLQEDVKVLKIKDGWRWVLGYEQDPNKPDFVNGMIRLEVWIRKFLNTDVDLLLEPLADKNKRDVKTGRAQPIKMVSERGIEKLD